MDYDPNLLDDPQWPCGKHKRVLIFPSYMVSSVEWRLRLLHPVSCPTWVGGGWGLVQRLLCLGDLHEGSLVWVPTEGPVLPPVQNPAGHLACKHHFQGWAASVHKVTSSGWGTLSSEGGCPSLYLHKPPWRGPGPSLVALSSSPAPFGVPWWLQAFVCMLSKHLAPGWG